MAQEFAVLYDGPAVDETNAIDASVFGQSLLALADLINESQDVLHPHGPDYRIRVTNTGTGSFAVFLEISELWDQITGFLTDRDAQAINTLITVFVGFVELMRALRGRTPESVQHLDDRSEFIVEDQEFIVERKVGSLYSSRKVRNSFRRFIQPVSRDVVDELRVKIPGQEPTTFTPEDRKAFDTPLDEETVLDEVVAMRLKIETIRWRTYRWEFSTPETGIFWATIEDEGFRARTDQRVESFERGDYLDCDVRIQQWEEADGSYRIERTVIAVLEHLPGDAAQQLTLHQPEADRGDADADDSHRE